MAFANASPTPEFAESGSLRDDDDDDIQGRRGNTSSGSVGGISGGSGGSSGSGGSGGSTGILQRALRFVLMRPGHGGYRKLRVSSSSQQESGDDYLGSEEYGHDGYDDRDGHPGHERFPRTCMGAFRQMVLSSWLNGLLVFVPIGIVAYLTHISPIAVFACNAIAVIPLSSLLTAATEKVASDAGDTVGALLNISLGNLVEMILFVALMNNHIRVVQASILGSILVNSLLILGTALLATGLSDNEPNYNTAETKLLSSLLFASVFVFLMPTAFGYTFDHSKRVSKATLQMSRVSSLMVLLIYLIYFIHEIRARPNTTAQEPASSDYQNDSERGRPVNQPMSELHNPARTIRFADEDSQRPSSVHSVGQKEFASVPIELQRIEMDGSADPGGINNDSDVESRGRGRRIDGVGIGYTSGRPSSLASLSRSRAHSQSQSHPQPHPHPQSHPLPAQAPLPPHMQMHSQAQHPARPSSHAHSNSHSHSYTRSMSVESQRGRRSRGNSLSSGFTSLGGPGLMRSGLTTLQLMRENSGAMNPPSNSRASLENSSAADLRHMRQPPSSQHQSSHGHGHDNSYSHLHPIGRQRQTPGEFLMAVIVLIVASGLMSVNAEFMVDTIDDVTHQGHLSESVIGLIILPIVGNIAEYVTVVSVAMRDKLDLAISVAIGSSIQIALCVTPLTVGAGWILNRSLSLTFSFFEMSALIGTALLVGLLVSSDGDRKLRTCGLKGALMCACYVIIGFGAYLSPNEKE